VSSLFDESDELMDVSGDGGSAPRPRRGLTESMIAGRRRPGDAPKPAPAGEAAAKPPVRRRRPAAAPAALAAEPVTPAKPEAAAAAPLRVRAPRAPRAPRTRRPAEVAPEPVVEEEEPLPSIADVLVTDLGTELLPAPPRELPPTPVPEPPAGEASALAGELGRLRALVEQQRTVLAELRAGMLTLGQQVDRSGYRPRLGIFVDVPNLMYGVEGGRPVHMGRLLNMLREGRQLVRATAYSPISDDPREPIEQQKFVAPFVPYDYRIVTKSLKRFADGSIKGNFDVEMAIDMVSMADRVDVIAIVSGDADFARAVEAVQNRGVRVEVVAFAGSTSLEMRALADHYLELGTVVDRVT